MRYLAYAASALLLTTVLAGCPGNPVRTVDTGMDGGVDGSVDGAMDGDLDGGMEDSTVGDTSTMPGDSSVVIPGTDDLLLRGVVLTPSGPLDPGEVLVRGDTITCVAADCSAEAGAMEATIIETGGIISPGLIDGHNHLPYNFFREWVPDPLRLFGNRYDWADDALYEAHVEPYTAHRSTGTHFCPAAKWGELRAIVHGTTTIQGQSLIQGCIDRLARNADHYHHLGHDHMRTSISSPRDITDDQATSYVASFVDPDEPTTRLAVHMAEGVMGSGSNLDLEFSSFAGRDTRTNRHMGISLLEASDGSYRGTGLLIHAVGISDTELQEVAATDAKIVWSPSSNMVLYGETANIEEILDLGITVGLGPDWTVSGEDDILGEMRFALDWAATTGVARITPELLFRMATEDGAEVVGLADSIGTLEVGKRADITVFGRVGGDPYAALAASRAEDVRLVLIDGVAYYGDIALEEATAVNGECDPLDACGVPKFLCARNTPGSDSRAGETVEDIRTQLVNILEGTGYPADEQYGRGDELLELVSCD